MISIFGDWFSDLVVVAAIFFFFIIFYYFIAKEGKVRNQAVLISSLLIFMITAFSVIGSLFFSDSFFSPNEGLIIFIVIMIFSFLALITVVRRLWPKE